MPKQSKYLKPILHWVHQRRYATSQQTVRRFWTYRGLDPSYGYDRIRRLVEKRLLASERLHPESGQRSEHVLSITPKGERDLGHEPIRRAPPFAFETYRLHMLQRTEATLERGVEGWEWVERERQDVIVEALKDFALLHSRHRFVAQMRARLQALSAENFPLGLPALIHRETGEVRLILEPKSRTGWRRAVRKLPHLGLLERVDLELVSANGIYCMEWADALRRWGTKKGHPVRTHQVEWFGSRSSPMKEGPAERCRWSRWGMDVLNLDSG